MLSGDSSLASLGLCSEETSGVLPVPWVSLQRPESRHSATALGLSA